MITHKAATVATLAKDKQRLQQQVDTIGDYEDRKQTLKGWATKLRGQVQVYRLFLRNDIPCEGGSSGISDTVEQVRELRETYEASAEHVINTNLRGLGQRIDAHCAALDRRLDNAWQRFLDDERPQSNEQLLDLLGKLPAFSKTVGKIRKLYANLRRVRRPTNQEEMDKVKGAIAELKNAWTTLEANDVPEAVVVFLQQAGSRGAKLSLLTPQVRTWLKEHGVADSFAVKLVNE